MPTIHRIPSRPAHVGSATVRRVLPHARCRQVGPWVFLDHFGPVDGPGGDVAPHPHIGLSTVSYLFEGCVEHRDSTGGHALVRPGEIHWMRAGRGIVHSERVPARPEDRAARTHGLQLWCAHPDGEEDQAPRFASWRELPELDLGGVRVQLLAGEGWGRSSPVEVTSPLIYAMAHLAAGQRLALPDHEQRGVYPVQGRVAVDGDASGAHEMLVVDRAARELVAVDDAVVAVLGGDAIGTRHFWWNLVHSDPAVLKAQAERWRRGDFPEVVGDAGPRIQGPPPPR